MINNNILLKIILTIFIFSFIPISFSQSLEKECFDGLLNVVEDSNFNLPEYLDYDFFLNNSFKTGKNNHFAAVGLEDDSSVNWTSYFDKIEYPFGLFTIESDRYGGLFTIESDRYGFEACFFSTEIILDENIQEINEEYKSKLGMKENVNIFDLNSGNTTFNVLIREIIYYSDILNKNEAIRDVMINLIPVDSAFMKDIQTRIQNEPEYAKYYQSSERNRIDKYLVLLLIIILLLVFILLYRKFKK